MVPDRIVDSSQSDGQLSGDFQTIAAYDNAAAQVAALHATLVPTRIYQLVNQFFLRGGACADIGCGIGRDCAWLAEQEYTVTGIDASEGMLNQARNRYPHIPFVKGSLPLMKEVADSTFTNVLCSAVIMHLAENQIASAAANLVRVTAENGVIVLSFRGTQNENWRENGKLYSPISPDKLISCFTADGCALLHHETEQEKGRDIVWNNLVFRKLPHPVA